MHPEFEPKQPASWLEGSRLRLERAGDVATIWLACPERRNAIDLGCTTELDEATALCAADRSINIIIIRTTGSAFSVGGDIDEFQAEADRIYDHVFDITDRFHRSTLRLATGPAVSIALVEGMAAGAGFALALSCDLMIASTDARFITAYSRLGFSPDGGASYFLADKLGATRAFAILALNDMLDAAEACRLGLVSRLVAPDAAGEAVEAMVGALHMATPESLSQTKALVAAATATTLASHLDAERDTIARLSDMPEAKRRIESFLKRRNEDARR